MSAFGNVGHVLTNTAQNTNQTTENYTCVSVLPTTNPTKYLYQLNNTSANRNIEYDVSTNQWNANPSTNGNHDPSIFISAGSSGSSIITPSNANSTLHIGYVANAGTHWMASFSVVYTSGPNVTVTRTAHTGIILNNNNNFTIKSPSPGSYYEKTGPRKFKIKFLDLNEPTNYLIQVKWTTLTGVISDIQTISSSPGDIELEYEGTAPSNIPVYGPITVQIDNYTVTNNNIQYSPGTVFNSFQYHETGPHTASFSPNFGLPGQTITVSMVDTNPYPDYNTWINYVSPNNSIANVLNANNNHDLIISPFHEGSGVYTGDTDGSYYLYGPFTSAASVNTSSSKLLASATYDTNYVAPPTTSNGGGKPDRYPLIMTNLFNRNRSLYSIGMTHKDTWDLFL